MLTASFALSFSNCSNLFRLLPFKCRILLKMANSILATEFPAPGLRSPFRYITGHNSQGDAVFVKVRLFLHTLTRAHLSDLARRTMATTVISCSVASQPSQSITVATAIQTSSRATSILNLLPKTRRVWNKIVCGCVG